MTDTVARPPQIETDLAASQVLLVRNLHTEFHLRESTVHAVDDVSLAIAAGECVGLVGESGCGKSTTGLSIMRLLPNVGHITQGSIELMGHDLTKLTEKQMERVRGDDVGMIFQDPMTALNPTMTIGRQIAESVRLHRGASKKQALSRALEVLALVGMPRPAERIDYYPHQLSGGLRQRVMIAIALACEPKLLIADEPTTALDVTIQAQILDLIDDLRDQLHMAVLLITHDLGVIAARASRVMVMYAGKIVETADTSALFTHMHHPYTKALLESIPRLDADRSLPLANIPGLPPDLSSEGGYCRFAPRCTYATEECRQNEPSLLAAAPFAAETDHLYACFHPVDGPSAIGPHAIAIREPEIPRRLAYIYDEDVILSVKGLVKEYPSGRSSFGSRHKQTVKAVSDVSFSVRRGETFGIVGESGCGKTTIGRLVVALEQPTAGAVHFDGDDLFQLSARDLREHRKDLQLMFQDPYSSLDPRARVGTTVGEPLAIQHIGDRGERRRSVAELLEEVGLSRRAAELYPHEFSGGQRQRIGFARALALSPKLVVADEPVSALDVSIQAQILNLMRSLQERHGLTYVVISHDLAVVRYLANSIGVMYLGKLVESGPAESVYTHPAHPYTKGLIDAIPLPDPAVATKNKTPVFGELPSPIDPPSGCRFRTRCPKAQEICAIEEPAAAVYGPGHIAHCHFPLVEPVDNVTTVQETA